MGKCRNGMISRQAESHAANNYAAVFNTLQAERSRTRYHPSIRCAKLAGILYSWLYWEFAFASPRPLLKIVQLNLQMCNQYSILMNGLNRSIC